jgi:2'-5' RNA ligase
MWRLFLAVPLPVPVREAVRAAQVGLAEHKLPLRWVDPEQSHLTLKFLGDTPPTKVDALADRFGELVNSSNAVELTTDHLGAFPHARTPHVVWIGATGEVEPVQELVSALDEAAVAFGFDAERRVYRPHVTVGRWMYAAHKPFDIADLLQDTPVQAAELPIDRVQLIRSILRARGPEYTLLAEWPLAT